MLSRKVDKFLSSSSSLPPTLLPALSALSPLFPSNTLSSRRFLRPLLARHTLRLSDQLRVLFDGLDGGLEEVEERGKRVIEEWEKVQKMRMDEKEGKKEQNGEKEIKVEKEWESLVIRKYGLVVRMVGG